MRVSTAAPIATGAPGSLPGRWRVFAFAAVASAVALAAFLAWTGFRVGGETLTTAVEDVGQAVAAMVAALSCAFAARRTSGRLRLVRRPDGPALCILRHNACGFRTVSSRNSKSGALVPGAQRFASSPALPQRSYSRAVSSRSVLLSICTMPGSTSSISARSPVSRDRTASAPIPPQQLQEPVWEILPFCHDRIGLGCQHLEIRIRADLDRASLIRPRTELLNVKLWKLGPLCRLPPEVRLKDGKSRSGSRSRRLAGGSNTTLARSSRVPRICYENNFLRRPSSPCTPGAGAAR